MSKQKGIRVTVTDLDNGDSETTDIKPGNYVLVCAEPAYVAHTQAYSRGTHILTVKGYVTKAEHEARRTEAAS